MGKKTAIWRRHVARILGIVFLMSQGAILDYYLIQGESSTWFAWILTDGVVLATWIAAMLISYRRLNSKRRYNIHHGEAFFQDELAFAYIAWLVYALHLVPQVATLFRTKASELDEKTMIFGPNMLKMGLCITPALFLFLLFAHHDSKPHTSRKFYLEKLSGAVTLDLFDSVEMLENLFEREVAIPDSMKIAILVFSCVNFFLPVLALYELKHNKFHDNGQVSPLSFKILYIVLFLFLVNVPFLILRLILWHSYHLEISVLLAKNALAIVLGLLEIAEFCGDERPKKCLSCNNTFLKSFFKSHLEVCATAATEEQQFRMSISAESPSNDSPSATTGDQDPGHAK